MGFNSHQMNGGLTDCLSDGDYKGHLYPVYYPYGKQSYSTGCNIHIIFTYLGLLDLKYIYRREYHCTAVYYEI